MQDEERIKYKEMIDVDIKDNRRDQSLETIPKRSFTGVYRIRGDSRIEFSGNQMRGSRENGGCQWRDEMSNSRSLGSRQVGNTNPGRRDTGNRQIHKSAL